MTLNISDAPPRRTLSVWIAAVTAVAMAAAVLAMTPTRANAVASPVPLGTAASFGVLAGATVTNTGPTVVNGLNVGVSPGTAITGFQTSDGGPGIVTPPGVLHRADAVAGQAKIDLNTAYNQAAGQTLRDATYNDAPHEFGGQTLTPGLYKANSSAGITGTLTLDAQGNSSAVWVFQIGSTLKTASASSVSFINGASPCNVYWQVGSSATLGTYSTFVGTILADTSITATTGAIINGRLLADAGLRGDGAVTLDSNRIFQGPCGTGATGGTTGAVVAGATAGGSTGASTVGVIAGVPTGGGTGGVLGGLLGGVLTTGGTTGGALGGLVAGATTSGTTGATSGGVHGGATGGTGHHHGGKPGQHGGHYGKPERPGGHYGKPEKPGHHDHGGKPENHGGYGGYGNKPKKDNGYGSVRH
ncbi:ice-binding family protein [Streptomyces melanogenes]|uniref:Ice-binding family protein n=1 Tax=Streptomyces melanogenes TaxID=67326 RepID=A0ABZ1XC14_9ACTN|nr:ice-binding family protein [Streptomyces melanogenes]